MRKGLTTNQKRAILIISGILIVLGVFLLIYQKNVERVTELEQDTSKKTNKVNFLSNLQTLVNEMQETTEQDQEEILTKSQEYPCKMTQQKVISNIYNLSKDSGIQLKSINPGTEKTFFKNGEFVGLSEDGDAGSSEQSESQDVEEAPAEKTPETKFAVNEMVGKVTSYEVELTGTRKQVLKAIDWIKNNPEHMALSAVNLSFDSSTGKLSGTFAVNFFSLNGNGKPYEEPDISSIVLGNKDVFGTFKK